jgi:hypothetical protein
VHDEADVNRKVECPLLILWAERGAMHRLFDVLATWRERASEARLCQADIFCRRNCRIRPTRKFEPSSALDLRCAKCGC